MITTPYIDDLFKLRPNFTELIPHRNYCDCCLQLEAFSEFDNGSELVLLTGPSQAGKSLVLQSFVRHLETNVFRDANADTLPVVGACANLARQGNTATRYVYEMLLGDVQSPLFDQMKIATADYRPYRAMTEPGMLAALTRALRVLETRYVIADEAQFMIKAKSDDFRGSLIESLKSLVSYGRTLILVGGYEVAKAILEYREHMASRPTIIHLARYNNNDDDIKNWCMILKVFSESEKLKFKDDLILLRLAEPLLDECHGETGILQHRLGLASCRARAAGSSITEQIIRDTRPTKRQWEVLRTNIEAGERTLNDLVDVFGSPISSALPAIGNAVHTAQPSKGAAKRKLKPFTAKPRRAYPALDV